MGTVFLQLLKGALYTPKCKAEIKMTPTVHSEFNCLDNNQKPLAMMNKLELV